MSTKNSHGYHLQIEEKLDRKLREALRIEADRRGVRRVTFSAFTRAALERAVEDVLGGSSPDLNSPGDRA